MLIQFRIQKIYGRVIVWVISSVHQGIAVELLQLGCLSVEREQVHLRGCNYCIDIEMQVICMWGWTPSKAPI